jgi:NADH:ubiquinone oxidoreductase subunit E
MLILRDLEAQSGKNVLDTDTLTEVAEQMNISQSAVAGFLGFYTMFKKNPRAKYLIRVCKSGPCHVMGSRTIFDEVEDILGIKPGEATKDGMFYLERCECLGVCSVAPAMMVNYDIHGNLTKESLKKIFDNYKKKEPEFGEECGPEVEEKACILKNDGQPKRLLADIGKIDPLSIDSYLQSGGYKAAEKAMKGLQPADIIDIVKDSGLRGRGGAGFPAGMNVIF